MQNENDQIKKEIDYINFIFSDQEMEKYLKSFDLFDAGITSREAGEKLKKTIIDNKLNQLTFF